MPERRVRILLVMAAALMVALGAGSAAAQTEKGRPRQQISQETPPRYQPPLRGAPRARVGGASRGPAAEVGRLDVLAPDHVGLTSQEQPTLYWFNARSVQLPAQLTITTADREAPLVEVDLPRPIPAGINSFRLAGTHVRLQTGIEYEWSVAIIADGAERSNDVVASGIIRRVVPSDPTRAAARASPARAADIYAQAGLWYDAIDAISHGIAKSPSDAALRRARAGLLAQVGLDEAAAYDRRAAR